MAFSMIHIRNAGLSCCVSNFYAKNNGNDGGNG
jgi:hypothetical protein